MGCPARMPCASGTLASTPAAIGLLYRKPAVALAAPLGGRMHAAREGTR